MCFCHAIMLSKIHIRNQKSPTEIEKNKPSRERYIKNQKSPTEIRRKKTFEGKAGVCQRSNSADDLLKTVAVFQLDRTRLAREKQLREEAVKEKEELERRMLQLQEEVRMAQDSLVPCDFVCMSTVCLLSTGQE